MLKFNVSLACSILFVFSVLVPAPEAVAAHEIVGAPGCKACHKARTGDQWKIWTESAHARAYDTLASEASRKIAADKGIGDPQKAEECLKCHTTRGFLGAEVPVSETGKYADSEGVGCEACHGPGSDYKPGSVMKDPVAARAAGLQSDRSPEACVRCHNAQSPTFKGFDFEERWAEIAHPVPGKADAQTESQAGVNNMPDTVAFTSSVGNVSFPHNTHAVELEIDCSECHHQIHAGELDTPHPGYLDSSWINCQICHNPNSKMSGQYYKCSECHHSQLESVADETLSSKVVIHKSCWKCHESGTGVEASEGCVECHVKAQK
ncbi:MAG: multiheme c-type cytochrome [Lysobacterales bacterium]